MELPVTFQCQPTPDHAVAFQFDIAPYEEPDELYRYGWDLMCGYGVVSPVVEFRGFSSENQLVLQDNVIMPAGHILHGNLQRRVAGQIGVNNRYGMVFLLVVQWRREGHADWEWCSADAVDWQTFRANVREIFAYSVLLAQFNVPEFQWPLHNVFQGQQVPQDVRLLFQTFGNHVLDELTVTEAEMQAFDGPLQLYDFICGAVFGIAANEFHPVNFRGILGDVNADGPVNGDLPVAPNQTVGGELRGQLGPLQVDGVVTGQLRINAQGQLVLLAVMWRAAEEETWLNYAPQMYQWEEFLSLVREIFVRSVLVAQF